MSASQLPTRRRSAVRSDPSPAAARRGDSAAGDSSLVLGRYCLQRRLGAGAFGTVWQARDERLDRDVAIKILPRERIVGGRFEREARTAARLAHPGIVTLYEAAVDDEGAYLVSELVRGPTLRDVIRDGSLSDQDIVAIAIALCDALEHAHAQGVIHRDVKPANVLIPDRPATPAQTAKLTDFGVALVVGGDSLTRTGDVVGTAAYMAPEQAEGLPAGAGADLYSLALVIYEALTGVNPVHPGTGAQRARRLGAHLPPLRRQRRDLPRELGQGVDLALRPRPRERGSMAELRRALVATQDQVPDDRRVAVPVVAARASTPPAGRARHGEPAAPSSERTQQWESVGPASPEQPLAPEPEVVAAAAPIAAAGNEWLTRALGAGATAGLAAWLCSHVLSPAPLGSAAVAVLAGALALVLPRAGWGALTAIFCVTAALEHRAGAALVVLIGALLPVVLLPRRGSAWPLAAGAPALGLIGLAGAWPALAARAGTSWRRAALGLTGWVWLLIAGPLADRVLYLSPLPDTPAPQLWTGSVHETVHHVLWPLVNAGALAPAPVWALAAVALPGIVRGRSLGGDALRVTVWSVALVLATTLALGVTHGARSLGTPGSAALGAAVGAAVALAPTAVKIWRGARQSAGPRAGLA
jgi:eukaryotic-like serine/threonine-protein kinase